MAPVLEACFTVGAGKGHTFLFCDSTRPAHGWRPQAKRLSQYQLGESGNPKELCPWRIRHGDLEGQGMLPCSSSVCTWRVRANLTISDRKNVGAAKTSGQAGKQAAEYATTAAGFL